MSRRMNLAAQNGYSMVAVMLTMLITSILAGAAFAAVGNDIPFARAAQDRKQAYAAAEAGLEYYLYQLTRDNDYWAKCTSVPAINGVPAPINQPNPSATARKWRNVAGTDARFSIELLPANGKTACDPTKGEETMLDAATGTFRVRSTGESRGERRSVVARFRRSSFLDYLYFTDYETSDPATYDSGDRSRASSECVRYRPARTSFCNEITFPDFDNIKGPFHTNDDILTCGSPTLGRTPRDIIEISGSRTNGWQGSGGDGCGGSPDFKGTVRWPAPTLSVPTSNAKLATIAASGGRVYYGETTIELRSDATMRVTSYSNSTGNSFTETVPFPANGVIYVHNNARLGCTSLDGPLEQTYSSADRGCAVAVVKGDYPKSLTIGSALDILINGDIKRVGDFPVLGLVAENFVRIKHQARDCSSNCHILDNYHVQAAILTLAHSFIVDNYNRGSRRGTLTVDGAIAQRFRGPVGTFNRESGQGVTGYTKNYNYDDRLKYRSPPYFLDPVAAAWRVIRANEQVPAAK